MLSSNSILSWKLGCVPKLVEPFAMRKQWMDYDSECDDAKDIYAFFIEDGMFAKHRKRW